MDGPAPPCRSSRSVHGENGPSGPTNVPRDRSIKPGRVAIVFPQNAAAQDFTGDGGLAPGIQKISRDFGDGWKAAPAASFLAKNALAAPLIQKASRISGNNRKIVGLLSVILLQVIGYKQIAW